MSGQVFTLRPHPAHPAPPFSLTGQVLRTPDVVVVRYVLAGDIACLCVPPAASPQAVDGLWQHTCLELFLAGIDDACYREFNFAPSAEWASYAFADYRVRDRAKRPLAPEIHCHGNAGVLELRAELACAELPPGPWRLGLAAVLEERDGRLSYWALHHPACRPDFHHRHGFTLILTE